MPSPTDYRDRPLLVALLLLVLFLSPAISWWLVPAPPWYLPYTLWGLVIALAAWRARSAARGGHDD